MSDLLAITSSFLLYPKLPKLGPGVATRKTKHSRSLNSLLLPVALQPPEVSISPEQA